ncbi:uncharacterized protein RCH25_018289 [Pelodytes ibericus]
MVGKPKELKTASITIQGLRRTDGPMFCCRVGIKLNQNIKQWQNRHGTYMRFPDQAWLEQLDIVPAFPGEDIMIPCYVNYPPGAKDSVEQVKWKVGASELCSDNQIIHTWAQHNGSRSHERFSLVNFPQDISLQIKGVKSTDKNQYCCEVKLSKSEYSSVHGTELAIGGNDINTFTYSNVHGTEPAVGDSSFTPKTPPQEYSAQLGNSVTLNCSYDHSMNKDALWIGIYWRLGNSIGNYSYHPSQKMVHHNYRGRTMLKDQSKLHIQSVQETDNDTSYYCLVMLRFCAETNKVSTNILHGQVARLSVTERLGVDMLVVIFLVVALLLVIILCGILFVLRKRGIIFVFKLQTVIQMSRQSRIMDSDGLLYAQLSMTSLNKGSTEKQTECDPQVIYSAIRSTHS